MATTRGQRTVHFVALGCPKNRVDTEVLAGFAAGRGLAIVGDPFEADVIVVNTCGFIESAREESVAALLDMARYRAEGRCRLLVAAGCLAQRYGEELARSLPEVDFFLGTAELERLGDILDAREAGRVTAGPAAHYLQRPGTPRFLEPGAPSAYVKIADGCSRRCAFCAIPSIRGQAQSRPIAEIAGEAAHLAAQGVVELNLVAQDTSAYGRDLGDGTDIVALVRALERIDGVRWIRLMYLYPDAVTDALLAAISASAKIAPYLDVPIQHASAAMLRRMRRGHGPRELRRLVERARRAVPGVFLRTAVLVGHPGETEEDVAALVGFIREAEFDHLGAFRYSDEAGTASARLAATVSRRESYDRWRRVMKVQRAISRRRLERLVGTTVEVLVEGADDESGYVLRGRHRGQAPEVDGATFLVSCEAAIGDIVTARVVEASDHDLVAEPI
jgi:ribosomal protein S12 methylthiotransferase